jgi:hypothetical protein
VGRVIIWINGTFGVGKTQVAHELQRRLSGSVIADPELLGFGIQRMYPPQARPDFQETPWWAPVLVGILADISRLHAGYVIVPMTLADDARHNRVMSGLRDAGCDVRQVTLLADGDVVRRRLRGRLEFRSGWAGQRVDRLTKVLRDPAYAPHLDTSKLDITRVVGETARLVGVRIAPADASRLRTSLRRLRVKLGHIRR